MRLTTFRNKGLTVEIRVMNNDGQIWFVGKDVAEALGYSNTRDALMRHVDDEDKTTVVIPDGCPNHKPQTVFINESGLYALILSSKLPQAKEFKRWVTSEVLPQIARTGGYIPVNEEDDEKMILCKAINIMNKTIEAMRPKAEYADKVLLSPTCYTMTQVAKGLSMTVYELTAWLHEHRIVYRSASGPLMLYADYQKNGYEAYRTSKGVNIIGDIAYTNTYLVWTEKGREMINRMVREWNVVDNI